MFPAGWALGGSPIRGAFPREYARSGHYGVFCLQNLKVSTLRFLKNSVGKVDHFVIGQKSSVLLREYATLRDYGMFYLLVFEGFHFAEFEEFCR